LPGGAAALVIALAAAPASAWEPSKPVEIVVAAGAGGSVRPDGADDAGAIQKNNLLKQPMVVSLKGGSNWGRNRFRS
jgi:tripartite-type tricarboxylate transporter receptor subunit TctC